MNRGQLQWLWNR